MSTQSDLEAIREFLAAGGAFGVDKEGNPVLPTGVLEAAAPTPEPASAGEGEGAPAASASPRKRRKRASSPTITPADVTPPAQPDAPEGEKRNGPHWQPFKNGLPGPLDGALRWVEGLPTPGGNLAILLILLFFVFAIIPVNQQYTRLQLIWLSLTGQAYLPGRPGDAVGAAAALGGIWPYLPGIVGGVLPWLEPTTGAGGGPGLPSGAGPAYLSPASEELLAPARPGEMLP